MEASWSLQGVIRLLNENVEVLIEKAKIRKYEV